MMKSDCRYPHLSVRISDLKGVSNIGAMERVTVRMRDDGVPPRTIAQYQMKIRAVTDFDQIVEESGHWVEIL